MRNVRSMLITGAAVAAAAIGGAAIANAATSTTTTTSASTTTTTTPSSSRTPGPGSGMPAHGSAAHEDAEKTVTGAAADKARAAAVKEVGSGTAGAVTTDYSGSGYEVTVTKSDGSTVEVHLDSSFAAITMPPRGAGAPGGYGAPTRNGGAPGGYGA